MSKVNLAAIQLLCSGLKDQSHIMRHQAKLQRCPLDAGMDLIPSSIDKVIFYPGWTELRVGTKLHLVFPPGTYGRVTDRSSTASVTGGAMVMPGVIDSGYTGEIVVRLQIIPPRVSFMTEEDWLKSDGNTCLTKDALLKAIADQTPIAQIIASPYLVIGAFQPTDLSKVDSGRGSNGFGSTNNLGGLNGK